MSRLIGKGFLELERRKNHIDLIEHTHPLRPIFLASIKDKDTKRLSATEICQRLESLKSELKYKQSAEQARLYVESLQDDVARCRVEEVLQNVGAATAQANLNPGPQIFASGDTSSYNLLDVGSLIQLPSSNPNNPPRYGTIRWMGTPPGVEGIIAGVELVIMLHTST